MKVNIANNNDVSHQRVEELKQEFKGLTKEQKELLLCRKITETGKAEDDFKDFDSFNYNQIITKDELEYLIKAADVGSLLPSAVYIMYNDALAYQEIYKESLVCYNRVLENYKGVANELKINSSLVLSHMLTYMLWNGYFSVNKNHSYKMQGRLLLPGMSYFDVIKGKGVCLAYAELLHKYLSVCDKNSAILACNCPTRKNAIKCNYRPEIEINEKSNIISKVSDAFETFFLRELINKLGNHTITLIEENGKLYAYDVTNIYALNIKDASTASIINGKGEFNLKPLMTFRKNPNSDPNHIYERLLLGNIEPALTRKEFIFSFENFMELINNNINLLDDAYDNIHSDLEFINKQIDEIEGHNKIFKKFKKSGKNT